MERAARRHRVDRERDRAAAVHRDAATDVPALAARVLALQRSVGNRATSDLLRAADASLAVARMKRARAASAPRRSVRQRVHSRALDRERFWAGPLFGSRARLAGGDSVAVDLGPAAGQPMYYGSRPGSDQCTAVNRLNKRRFKQRLWIKGHLLNDNLGGRGIAENLTPMTHTANMAYKNHFETPVKNAITSCYTNGQAPNANWYGVRVDVQVVGQRWGFAPSAEVRAVAQSVDATCQYIFRPRGGGATQVTAQPAWAPALPGPVSTICFQ